MANMVGTGACNGYQGYRSVPSNSVTITPGATSDATIWNEEGYTTGLVESTFESIAMNGTTAFYGSGVLFSVGVLDVKGMPPDNAVIPPETQPDFTRQLGCVPIASATAHLIRSSQEGLGHGGTFLVERRPVGID